MQGAYAESMRRRDGEKALRRHAEEFDRVTGHAIRVPREHFVEALAARHRRAQPGGRADHDRCRTPRPRRRTRHHQAADLRCPEGRRTGRLARSRRAQQIARWRAGACGQFGRRAGRAGPSRCRAAWAIDSRGEHQTRMNTHFSLFDFDLT